MNRHRIRANSRANGGFSMIEVLVAIVVLSFGLLGMVGLQAASLQANRDARLQYTAGTLARELAEMMRGNKDVAMQPTASDNPYLGTFTTAATTADYCLAVGSNCVSSSSSTQKKIADAEMTEWLARVNAELPGAKVTVCLDTTPYDSSGLPQWNCTAPTATTNAIMVIKMGWTRANTDRSATGASALKTVADSDARPTILLPVTAASSLPIAY